MHTPDTIRQNGQSKLAETAARSKQLGVGSGGYNPPRMDGGYPLNSKNRNRTAGKQPQNKKRTYICGA